MPLRPILLEAVSGNAGQANLQASVGYEYAGLLLERVTGTTAITDISKVQVFQNSVPTLNASGQQIDERNKYDGLDAFATRNTLTLPFYLTGAKDARMSEMTDVNTGVKSPNDPSLYIDSLMVQMDIGAGNSTWKAYGLVDDKRAEGPGVVKHERSVLKACAGGENRFSDVLKGADLNRMLSRIFLKLDAGAVSNLRLEADGKRFWDASINASNQVAADGGKTLGGYWSAVYDFRASGFGFAPDALPFSRTCRCC